MASDLRQDGTGGTRTVLRTAVRDFSTSLRQLVANVSDSTAQLQRAVDLPPNTSAREFKVMVQDMEEELTELSQQVQHLQRFSVDSISFEELLGHCTAVYKNNHHISSQLSRHLQQLGCAPPLGLQQPADPLQSSRSGRAVRFSADAAGAVTGEASDPDDLMEDVDAGPAVMSVSASLRHRQQTPVSRLPSSRMSPSDEEDDSDGSDDGQRAFGTDLLQQSRLQAVSGLNASAGTVKPAKPSFVSTLPKGTGGTQMGTGAENLPPQHAAATAAGASAWASQRQPLTAAKPCRPSLDSHAASTPDMLDMLSPSLLALQQKYGGSGGSDASAAAAGALGSGSTQQQDDMDADPPGALASDPIGQQQQQLGSGHRLSFGSSSPGLPGAPAPFNSGLSTLHAANDVRGAANQDQGRLAQPAFAIEEDTCALYQELIRSKGVPCGSRQSTLAVPRRPSPAIGPCAAAAAQPAPAAPPDCVHEQPQQDSGSQDKQAQAQQMSSTLDQLEALWVSSGQAALTPSRARGPHSDALQAALTPSRRGRSRTPSKTRASHEYFTRQAAKAAAEEQAAGGAAFVGVGGGRLAQQLEAAPSVAVPPSASFGARPSRPDPSSSGPSQYLQQPHQWQVQAPSAGSDGVPVGTPAAPTSTSPPRTGSTGHSSLSMVQLPAGRVLSPGTSQLLSLVYGGAGGVAAAEQANRAASATLAASHTPGVSASVPRFVAPAPALYAQPAAVAPHASAMKADSGGITPGGQPVSGSQVAGAPRLSEEIYAALPAFCRSQMPLELLEQGYRELHSLVAARSQGSAVPTFSLEDLEQQGMPAARSKVFINCLVRVGLAELQRVPSGAFAYRLK